MNSSGHCALCKSRERDIVQSQSLALLNRAQPCKLDFAVCRACGHIQQWPPVEAGLMAHHYKTFATYEVFGDAAALRAAPPSRHAARFLGLAADAGLRPGRAYEVGCASGAMLHQFRQQGWQVRGCDPSPSARSQAGEIFAIDVDLGGEEDALPHQQDLDLILLCHVLEHLYDPPAALNRLQAALAPQGHLLLEVPCAIAPEQLPPGWFTFEHLHYYQPAILEQLLRQAGFEAVETRIDRASEHYPVITLAARKAQPPARRDQAPDPSAGLSLAQRYVARDDALWAAAVSPLAQIQEPVFVYGAGIHTSQLLDRTGLASWVTAIADRDSKKWGQTLAGKPVISPQQLLAWPSRAPVIISSYVSETQIIPALLKEGLPASRILPLYSPMPDSTMPDRLRAAG
ncbi:MAG TPA: methyltransferase domain-containing protein [Rhizomicrobium sp.]|nr:methyltransferase domain-containing protein [Rhizomicrobium sp.]